MPVAPVKIDEIDDVTPPDAVHHVAQRAAENQRQADGHQTLGLRVTAHPDQNPHAHRHAQRHKKQGRRIRQHRECRAGVVQPDEVEVGNQRQHVVVLEIAHHQLLGHLVDQNHGGRKPQPVNIFVFNRHGSAGFQTKRQAREGHKINSPPRFARTRRVTKAPLHRLIAGATPHGRALRHGWPARGDQPYVVSPRPGPPWPAGRPMTRRARSR